jgi:hypothetical protein
MIGGSAGLPGLADNSTGRACSFAWRAQNSLSRTAGKGPRSALATKVIGFHGGTVPWACAAAGAGIANRANPAAIHIDFMAIPIR